MNSAITIDKKTARSKYYVASLDGVPLATNGEDNDRFDAITFFLPNRAAMARLLNSRPKVDRRLVFYEPSEGAENKDLFSVWAIHLSPEHIQLDIQIGAQHVQGRTNVGASLVLKNLEREVKEPFKVRSAYHYHGMEALSLLSLGYDEPYTKKIGEHIKDAGRSLKTLLNDTIKKLEAPTWKPAWDKSEKSFTKDCIVPLIRAMGYEQVRYVHSSGEYGRDVVFSKEDLFGIRRYYGVQAKKGNVSGSAAGDVDTIFSQLDDAFRMPVRQVDSATEVYLSGMFIICSGAYTNNAEEKILRKLHRGLHGSVSFLSKDNIQTLWVRFMSPKTR